MLFLFFIFILPLSPVQKAGIKPLLVFSNFISCNPCIHDILKLKELGEGTRDREREADLTI